MGYESQLFVGRGLLNDDPQWLQVQTIFKLGKMGYDGFWHDLLKRHPAPEEPQWFVFADDGDTEILEDRYGDCLVELPVFEVIAALEDYDYAPAQAAAAYLRAWTGGELTILHYGY